MPLVVLQALKDVGFQPAKPLEVIMFTTEEASRFSVPCLGRCHLLSPPAGVCHLCSGRYCAMPQLYEGPERYGDTKLEASGAGSQILVAC
jgi:hypothetical protein